MAAAHLIRRVALPLIAALPAACGSTPPPAPLAQPPDFSASFEYFAGTLLSGPLGADAVRAVPAAPERALRLEAKLLLLDSFGRFEELAKEHEGEVLPLADHLSLVAALGAPVAVDATSRLCSGGSLVRGAAARGLFDELAASAPAGARLLAERDDVVLPSASTALAAKGAAASLLSVGVHGGEEGRADVTLHFETADRGGELLKLADDLVAGGEPLLLVVPSPFRDATERACALLLRLDPPPAPESSREAADHHAAEVKGALTKIARAAEEAAKATTRASARDMRSSAIATALRGLTPDASSRAALVYLASTSKAELLGDVALVASEEDLVRLLQSLCGDRDAMLEQQGDADRLGWSLERAAWRFLATTAQEMEMAPELSALLFLHAGAVGGWPATLEDLADTSDDHAAFQSRLTQENLRLLEDHSAAVRVRAFDWLAARRAAPEGFDPLAPLAARRAILAREHAGE